MSVVISNPLAKMTQSTSYSTPFATIPFSVSRSTPLHSDTSTSVTFGRLNVGRYSSLLHGRLHMNR
ncbi:Uncharacterised protein [Mycobacterium tuberculosis]|nr:Uncharacterised protein [Mycobacterium tuberculosis]